MSDPFEALRGSSVDASPDVDVIRGRARRIEQRRRLLVGASAASVAAVALIAVVLSVGPDRGPAQLATEGAREESRVQTEAPYADSAESLTDSAVEGASGRSSPSAGTAGDAPAQAPAPAGGETTSRAKATSPNEPLVAKVTAEGRPIGGGDFTLEVCNTSKEQVSRTFGDSRRYDFEVSRDGKTVWTWSDGKAFAQMLGEESWKAGECKKWSDSWDEPMTGEYKVVGVLTSNPEVRSKAVPFCTGLC